VTAVHVGGEVTTVAHTLIRATLEVPVLVKDDLKNQSGSIELFKVKTYNSNVFGVKLWKS